ncbi:MAG: hypothetical protein AABN95_03450 [Acidobacteriota bacterium]
MKDTLINSGRLPFAKRIGPLAYSLILILAVAGSLIFWPLATTLSKAMRSALNAPAFGSAIPVQVPTSTYYLHGTGPVANPPTLFLNTTAPTATSEKYWDSTSINRNSGNPWKEVGTWSAASAVTPSTLASLSDFHAWLGLKNSDDQGTYFDLRVEAYKNNGLLASGQSLCITGVTRNPASAKEVVVAFDAFSATSFNGTSDELKLKVLTRVGTNESGGSCGGHNGAVGLRLYFDAVSRASRFNATQETSDTTPPVLNVEQPADNSITSATEINVTGTFSDQSQTTITVNGVTATVQGNNFNATVQLSEGQNSLLIAATDAAGNRTEISRIVTRDTTAPILNVVAPEDFTFTKANEIQISGNFVDAISITVNGTAPLVDGNNFTATVPLTNEGVNTITVRAADAAGNQSELFHTVNRDTASPTISLMSPVEGEISRLLLTRGSVSDASPVTVTVDGVQQPFEDGFFELQIEVAEGVRQVRVIATDAAGNLSEVVRSLTIDQTSPVFSNISPAEGTIVNSPATISGRVTDAAAVTVKVNEAIAIVGSNGDFTAGNIPLLEGENQLLLTAVDAAGNQNDFSLTLIGQDRTPPSAPVLFPVVSPTRLTTSTVEGRAEAGSLIVITGGIEPVTANAAFGSGLFAANVNLNVGVNNFSIVAKDADGNASPAAQISITSNPNMELPPTGQPAQINISTGNAQKGLVNTALPRPLIVIITDRAGDPVANVTVRFTVQEGGGRFTAGNNEFVEVNTDAQGYASATYVAGATVGAQQVRVDFAGNTIGPVIFLAQALESSGSETTVSGSVLDQNLRALPNVLVRIGGQQTRTGADGRFRVGNVATGPHQLLELIGRDQITLPGRWPNITYDFDVLPGVDNELGRPLFLPKVNAGISMPLDANNVVTQDTSFELAVVGGQPAIRVTAKAGTRIIFPPDVTDKRLSVTRIATNRVPMTLEDGRATNLYISVQPSGAVFETPLEISFPNLDHSPANSEVLLMSFDHDAGRYVRVGTGHVTADGREVKSDAGSGIRVGAWHALPPPEPEPEVTVVGHIQIEGNPAFEDKVITSVNAWVDGAPASVMPNPTRGSTENPPRFFIRVTLPLAEGEVRVARIESLVIAEKKLNIKLDSADSRFAPSVERFNFKYTITAPDATPPTVAKLEIFKAGDLSNPIYKDALQLTAEKLDYTQSGVSGWDGKMNQGAGSGKYIEPKNGPFTVRVSAATKADLSDVVKAEKTTKVEIDSMTLTPDNDFKSFKPNLTATEVDSPIELTVKVKNKAGNGVVTAIPFKIKWSFEDPDDNSGNNIIDPNGGAGDDNIEIRFGGKAANTGGTPAAARTMWKAVSGFTSTISPDGQTVEAELSTSGADQGKSKLTFSTSVIGGDNYYLIAKYLMDDGTTPVKDKKSGKWSVWKRLDFRNVYRMNGGADVDTIMDRDNINPAFNGDGYTTYTLGPVNRLIAGPQSPEFVASLRPPLTAELPAQLPAPPDSQNAIDIKAQAWFDRNRAHINAEHRRFIASIGAPRYSVIGAKYYHPKYDSNPSTGSGPANDHYPAATRITTDTGEVIDPDIEWSPGVQGAEIDEIAFIFLNIANPERRTIVGRHEVGHASDHIQFGLGDGNNLDHASSGLMHPTADIPGMPPNGNPNFSPRSILRLRGVRP